jgi:hypothetical protein
MTALSGSEIWNILKRCTVTSEYIKDIRTRDIPVPQNPSLNSKRFAAYVINTGYASAGIHWVLAYFTPSYNIFFDSFGRAPTELLLASQVKRFDTCILYNIKRLQHSKSSVCGHWVIYYTYFLCKGKTLSEINSNFSATNFKENDKIVYNFVKNLAASCQVHLK